MKYTIEVVGHGGAVNVTGVDLDTLDMVIRSFQNNRSFEMRTPKGNLYVNTENALALRITELEGD